MRTILLSTLGAVVMVMFLGGCTASVKTDNGHAVSTGVHAG